MRSTLVIVRVYTDMKVIVVFASVACFRGSGSVRVAELTHQRILVVHCTPVGIALGKEAARHTRVNRCDVGPWSGVDRHKVLRTCALLTTATSSPAWEGVDHKKIPQRGGRKGEEGWRERTQRKQWSCLVNNNIYRAEHTPRSAVFNVLVLPLIINICFTNINKQACFRKSNRC